MIEEEEEGGGDTYYRDDSANDAYGVVEEVEADDGEEADVLEIHCHDADLVDDEMNGGISDQTTADATRRIRTDGYAVRTENRRAPNECDIGDGGNKRRTSSKKPLSRPRNDRRTRRGRKRTLQNLPRSILQAWYVRWTRDGFEDLVYAMCNCNEEPNVVFAGLCYQRNNVYTMLLRNCNGKRRYWYDVSHRRDRFFDRSDDISSDFERAMAWRSKAIGRSCTSPGYDLASFALQNVTTDKRSDDGIASSLIIITTGDMLTETAVNSQLVCSNYELAKRSDGSVWHQRPWQVGSPYSIDRRQRSKAATNHNNAVGCRVCQKAVRTVTQDNASLPTCLCWDHSAAHMAASTTDQTRVYGAVILDLQFVQDADTDETVCRVRLVNTEPTATRTINATATRSGTLPIAEFVLSSLTDHKRALYRPDPRPINETGTPVAFDLVHAYTCRDLHHDHGDIFPSMPGRGLGGGPNVGTVRFHDTTLGRVIDQTYCVVNQFQRQ